MTPAVADTRVRRRRARSRRPSAPILNDRRRPGRIRSVACSRRRTMPAVLAALSFAGTLLTGIALTDPARAGEWAVISCSQPDGLPAPTDGWVAGGAGDDKGSISTCASPGGALISQVGDQVEQAAYQPATWTWTAPAGSTISGGTLSMGFYTPEGQDYAETPENSYDSADVIGNCQYNTGSCGSQWNFETDSIAPSQAGGTQIFLGAECVASVEGHNSCQQPGDPELAANGLDAQTDLYSATIDLSNDATPTGSGFSGTLLEPGASGTADVLFTAADPDGPGVARVTATIDGTAVYNHTPDSNGGACQSVGNDTTGAPEYLSTQPCKTAEAVDIPVDTTQLTSGQHHLVLSVTDAAGNTSVVDDAMISVSNPTSATELAAGSGPTGISASWHVSLAISPRRVHQGTVITLSGLVSTTPRPPAGKLIYLQARTVSTGWRVHDGRRRRTRVFGQWITFRVLNAKPNGRYAATYRFRLGGDHRYELRAVAPAEGGYENPTGSSPPILITET